jgi:hypothetical protein
LIDILQVRIDLLKKERQQKISELINTMTKEQTNTTPATTDAPATTENDTNNSKTKNTIQKRNINKK